MLATSTNHVVVVRYDPLHNYNNEWVYNRAEIDEARVVWARSMGEEKDRRLLEYFSDRTAWLYDVRGTRVLVQPHPLRGD